MGDDGKETHCPGAALSNAAGAVPLPAVAGWVVVDVDEVVCVSGIGHDDVDKDCRLDGDRVDLVAEGSAETL